MKEHLVLTKHVMMVLDKIVLADKLLIDLSIEFKYKDQELLHAKL